MHHFSYSLKCHHSVSSSLYIFIHLSIHFHFQVMWQVWMFWTIEAIFSIIMSQSCTRYVALFMQRVQNILRYIYILAYVSVGLYCSCVSPCLNDILSVVFKTFVQLLETVYIIRHSISPIYCYYIFSNCHKTFAIMFISFGTKLFQRCINQKFWNK